jgi:hypothetical protein
LPRQGGVQFHRGAFNPDFAVGIDVKSEEQAFGSEGNGPVSFGSKFTVQRIAVV